MARMQEFNREETLTKAMQIFWQKGYKATSMKDLINEMGIQPGSIYNAFGDKHTLFIEAVKLYGDVITTNAIKTLRKDGSPMDNLKQFFKEFVERPIDKKCIGCLVVNSVVELAPHDKEAEKVIKSILTKIENAFFDCLERAVDLGEISSSKNIKALSRYLASSTHGLLITGKASATREEMRDIVEIILSTLE